MYTSGSSGVPKGVGATHGGVVGLASDGRFGGGAHGCVLWHSPSVFDASSYEVWVPLLRGGCVVVGEGGVELDGRVVREVVGGGVTGLWLTAGLFGVVAEEDPGCFAGLGELWVGGDVVSAGAVARVRAAVPGLVVVNGYGPTEATVFVTSYRVGGVVGGEVPVGRPMDNMRVFVLDAGLRPVPPGAVGELYVA
ncbi:AMP-binding protein, partial [Streptomyces ziwulingensis]|uniref:AMP-binding protein n=1 Tax=Streptomyces ziwulingensis TaxID=1045501 RepID=UPI0031E81A43